MFIAWPAVEDGCLCAFLLRSLAGSISNTMDLESTRSMRATPWLGVLVAGWVVQSSGIRIGRKIAFDGCCMALLDRCKLAFWTPSATAPHHQQNKQATRPHNKQPSGQQTAAPRRDRIGQAHQPIGRGATTAMSAQPRGRGAGGGSRGASPAAAAEVEQPPQEEPKQTAGKANGRGRRKAGGRGPAKAAAAAAASTGMLEGEEEEELQEEEGAAGSGQKGEDTETEGEQEDGDEDEEEEEGSTASPAVVVGGGGGGSGSANEKKRARRGGAGGMMPHPHPAPEEEGGGGKKDLYPYQALVDAFCQHLATKPNPLAPKTIQVCILCVLVVMMAACGHFD